MSKKDTQLHAIACHEWQLFKSLVGDKAITRAMVIMLRRRGASYGQISKQLGISREWACQLYLRWHDETVNESLTEQHKIS